MHQEDIIYDNFEQWKYLYENYSFNHLYLFCRRYFYFYPAWIEKKKLVLTDVYGVKDYCHRGNALVFPLSLKAHINSLPVAGFQ